MRLTMVNNNKKFNGTKEKQKLIRIFVTNFAHEFYKKLLNIV
jgi:hypothetical protein